MDYVVLAVLIGAAATFFFAKSCEKEIKSVEMTKMPVEKYADEGVATIASLLKKHKAFEEHKNIVDSMELMLYAVRNERDLDALLVDDDITVEIGRQYVEKFVTNPSPLMCYLAGVIEREYDALRVYSNICVQDVHEIRKTLDVFYYKYEFITRNTSRS